MHCLSLSTNKNTGERRKQICWAWWTDVSADDKCKSVFRSSVRTFHNLITVKGRPINTLISFFELKLLPGQSRLCMEAHLGSNWRELALEFV